MVDLAMKLKDLVEVSRQYGGNPEFVLAGGGNTSFKDESHLYIKASGISLAGISETGFTKIERKKLDAIWEKEYPAETGAREAAVLKDLMDARAPGEGKRPSVETLMHGFFPFAFVVHTHPCMVNGLTCGKGGKKAFSKLFHADAIWIDVVNPGFILANEVKKAFENYAARRGSFPKIMFMENHGLVVAGDGIAEIRSLTESVYERLGAMVKTAPKLASLPADGERVGEIASLIAERLEGEKSVLFETNIEIAQLVNDEASFRSVSSSFSPDHIVYYGYEILYIHSSETLAEKWKEYQKRNGTGPRIVAVKDLGFFACSPSRAGSMTARNLFLDAVKISAYSRSFGGPKFMPKDKIDFIRNWEVEKYRSKVKLEN